MSGQIISKDNDLKMISKIVDFLAVEQRSRQLYFEVKDSHGRSFKYVSMKDRPNEINGKVKHSTTDEAFHDLVDRMSDEGRPRTRLHAYLKDDEDHEKEEIEEEEGSDQED